MLSEFEMAVWVANSAARTLALSPTRSACSAATSLVRVDSRVAPGGGAEGGGAAPRGVTAGNGAASGGGAEGIGAEAD